MNNNNNFFIEVSENKKNDKLFSFISEIKNRLVTEIYLIEKPLPSPYSQREYSNENSYMILIPGKKIIFVDCLDNDNDIEDYKDEILDDISEMAGVLGFKNLIGRPKNWEQNGLIATFQLKKLLEYAQGKNYDEFLIEIDFRDNIEAKRKSQIIVSLLIGVANNPNIITKLVPLSVLEKVKQRIVLFDLDQTRFIYYEPNKKVIKVQGLSGTGKTELLFHKIKNLYLSSDNIKIALTCHNKVLANTLKERLINFFNLAKVTKQIKQEDLFVARAWGTETNPFSGLYSYITHFYGIPFYPFYQFESFDLTCKRAIEDLKNFGVEEYAFDYIFIDEGQDFSDSFIELCKLVTKEKVFVVGDIFQDIFKKEDINTIVEADFVLKRCYRTDPKTLMFAHALGMGLFEEKKLNWLEDKEWEFCGYTVERKNEEVILRREPIKRFDDEELDNIKDSVKICCDSKDLIEDIISIIKDCRKQYSDIEPGDICVIFLDNDKDIYDMMSKLEGKIYSEFGWESNRAYISKKNKKDAVFLSNINNAKGLEFSFSICVTKEIKDDLRYRNSLYTMLSRSFLKSFLITKDSEEKLKTILGGLKKVMEEYCIVTKEPTTEEKEEIKRLQIHAKKSPDEIFEEVCDEFHIENEERKAIKKLIIKRKGSLPSNKSELREIIAKLEDIWD
ncbi:DEAD/DEAH box helicase [Caldicellulosiruptoraceae bacterium PP1]